MQAVDAIYEACEECGTTRFSMLPSRMMGSMSQPRAFCDFTLDEIREAERFLMRCGLLEARAN